MIKIKGKRIPTLLVVVPLWILTMLVVLGIYIIISISSVSIKDTLRTGFTIAEGADVPKIVEAKGKASDGEMYNSTSNTKYTYSYADLNGLRVGLFASSYYLPYSKDDVKTDGKFEFYIGFYKTNKEDNKAVTISSCNIVVAEKWHNYSSSKASISSYYHTSTLDKKVMTFYNSVRTISISSEQQFPKRYVLGMVNVKQPKVYVQIDYKIGSESNSSIIEYEYNDFFIEGQTKVNK